MKEIPAETSSYRKIEEVRKAGEQAAALTRQLLASGRKQISQPKVLDLNAVVKGITNMVRRVIGDRVELIVDLDAALGQIKADEGQIQQILLNLAVNSRDAMRGCGRLAIQTRNVLVDSCAGPQDLSANPGAFVVLSISDTGCGMDEETQSLSSNLFLPRRNRARGRGWAFPLFTGL